MSIWVGTLVAVGKQILIGLAPGLFYRITETSDYRVTEDGKDNRITE